MSNNPVFKKVATSLLIRKSMVWNKGFLRGSSVVGWQSIHTVPIMGLIFTPIVEVMENLDKVSKETVNLNQATTEENKSFQEEIIKVAEDNGWVEETVYADIKRCEKYLNGLDLIQYIVPAESAAPHIAEFLRLKGKKINPEWIELEPWQKELLANLQEQFAYQKSLSLVKSTHYDYEVRNIVNNRISLYANRCEKYTQLFNTLKPLTDYHGSKERTAQTA